MALVARFTCNKIVQSAAYSPPDDPAVNIDVTLSAYLGHDDDDRTHEWAKWTPSGELTMQITNPAAAGFFEPGADYRLTISRFMPQNARQESSDVSAAS